MTKTKYILAVRMGNTNQLFRFDNKHNRAMALRDMVIAGMVDSHAFSETRGKLCPACETFSLNYLRNQTLTRGVTQYYVCGECNSEIRIIKP